MGGGGGGSGKKKKKKSDLFGCIFFIVGIIFKLVPSGKLISNTNKSIGVVFTLLIISEKFAN